MAFDRDRDWKGRSGEVADARRAQRITELRRAQRAALAAQHVTGDESWDHFLSLLQERLNTAKERMGLVVEKLQNSNDFTTEALINQKLAVRLLGVEIEVVEWVMGLPRELVEQGDRASQLIEQSGESAR